MPHDYLAQVIQEFETYGRARGLGPGALAEAIRRREPITPPCHKPNKAELAEQKRQADLEAEKAKRQREAEQAAREQEKDRALRERWRELPDTERQTIRAKVLAEYPHARGLPADSRLVEDLCLRELENEHLETVT